MSRRGKKSEQTVKIGKAARTAKRANAADSKNGLPSSYWKACEVARVGQYKQARAAYTKLERSVSKVNSDARLRALIQNDLAVIAAMQGQLSEASEKWRAVLEVGALCLPARLNLGLVQAELGRSAAPAPDLVDPTGANGDLNVEVGVPVSPPPPAVNPPSCIRIAVISLLFNWPSTGGGNMHTAGLVDFLGRDGFEVRHFYARYPAGGIGRVDGDGHLGGGGER
jgi:hypothetical protein